MEAGAQANAEATHTAGSECGRGEADRRAIAHQSPCRQVSIDSQACMGYTTHRPGERAWVLVCLDNCPAPM